MHIDLCILKKISTTFLPLELYENVFVGVDGTRNTKHFKHELIL